MLAPIIALLSAVEVVAADKFLALPFGKRPRSSALGKRQEDFSAPLNNYLPLYEYFATIQVGTPPQTVELVLDTGSSDLWVFGTGSCVEEDNGGACEGGEYDASRSSTYKLVAEGDFYIKYATAGSGVRGDYVNETVSMEDVVLESITIAVATQANETSTGIMGIGFDTNEAIVVAYDQNPYANFPDQLLRQGKIRAKAYSLYLDDLASDSGIILFGGYDTNKFTGDMKMLPLQEDANSGIVNTFLIAWTSFSKTNTSGTFFIRSGDEFPVSALLDSGTSLTYVSPELFEILRREFNAAYDDEGGAYIISCDYQQSSSTLDFGFGGPDGPVISVPYPELAVPIYYLDGSRYVTHSGEPICVFGIQPNPLFYLPIVMGQTFLRSAYVLYDLENLAVGVAPVVYNSATSNILDYQAEGAQSRITTISSGPTITQSMGGLYDPSTSFTGAFTTESHSRQFTRSYPFDAVPISQAASLTALTGVVAIPTTTTDQSFTVQTSMPPEDTSRRLVDPVSTAVLTSQSSSSPHDTAFLTTTSIAPISSETAVISSTTSMQTATMSTTAAAAASDTSAGNNVAPPKLLRLDGTMMLTGALVVSLVCGIWLS